MIPRTAIPACFAFRFGTFVCTYTPPPVSFRLSALLCPSTFGPLVKLVRYFHPQRGKWLGSKGVAVGRHLKSHSIQKRVCRHAQPARAFTARVHYCDPNPSKDKNWAGLSSNHTNTRAASPLPSRPFSSTHILSFAPSGPTPNQHPPASLQSYTPAAPLSLDLHQIRPRGTRRPRVLQLPGQHHHAVPRLHEAQGARVLEDGALLCLVDVGG